MGDYNTQCPRCSGSIKLTAFTGFTNITVEPDGWSYGEEGIDSQDEVFHCSDCGFQVPAGYVFKTTSKKVAKAIMEQESSSVTKTDK